MIPVSLTIKGLYSYQQPTTIDFSNLTSAGLFGIFGAVGSGKSTILEAISFVLYGLTERLGQKGDDRSYNMMNLKSNELLIDFVFTCGDCDDKYKFTVNAKRNRKNFLDAGTFFRKAYKWEDGWKPTELDAEQILGLSYQNFKRTIIIPQGKFQEFLQLKDAERVQMLKEIFGLEKFELGGRVLKLTRENDLKVSNVQGQMQALPTVTLEIIHERESAISQLEKELLDVEQNLKKVKQEEVALQELKGLFEDLENKNNVLAALKREVAHNDERDREVQKFERFNQLFKYPLEDKAKVEKSIASQTDDAKKLEDELSLLQKNVEEEKEKVGRLKGAYEDRELLLKKAEELEKVISIKGINRSIAALSDRINKGQKAVSDEEETADTLHKQGTEIKTEIERAEKDLPDTALLVKINNWFLQLNQLRQALSKAQDDETSVAGNTDIAKAKIQSILRSIAAHAAFPDFPPTLSAAQDIINKTLQQYDIESRQLNESLQYLQLSQKLEDFAKGLQDDEECPLCGSIHHPKVYSNESVSAELQQLERKLSTVQQNKGILNAALISLSGAYSGYENHCSRLQQVQSEVQRLRSESIEYEQSFTFNNFTLNDEDKVDQQLIGIEQKNSELKDLRASLAQKQGDIETANKNILKYRGAVESLIAQKAGEEGQLNALKSQIVLHNLKEQQELDDSNLRRVIEDLKGQYSSVTREYEAAQKAVQDYTTQAASLSGRQQELLKQIEAGEEQKEALERQLESLLAAESLSSLDQVTELLSIQIDVTKERQQIEEFRRELYAAEAAMKEASAKVEGKSYTQESLAAIIARIESLSGLATEKKEQLITQKNELKQLNQQMELRRELQKELDKLSLRAENLKVLANLFRGSGFVNYVSSVYLHNLLNTANQRFHKMSKQKLMLELGEDNSFRVRDFLNNGQLRSVKTLSGGQTFQAALSLALALADNIQKLTKSKQNFFFLDEGFGSLDKDSLALVFETLKGLRKENRIVGVISHVEEMQQEIPVNLKVENNAERGSLVIESWKNNGSNR